MNYKKTKLGSYYVCCWKKVDNLIATIDLNGKQIDGKLMTMPMGDISLKFKSFNWEVIELKEGNNLKIIETLLIAKKKQVMETNSNYYAH